MVTTILEACPAPRGGQGRRGRSRRRRSTGTRRRGDLPSRRGRSTRGACDGVVARSIVDLLEHLPRAVRRSSSRSWRWRRSTDPASVPTAASSRPSLAAVDSNKAPRVARRRAPDPRLRVRRRRRRRPVRAGERGSGLVVNVGTGAQTSIRDLWDARRRDQRLGADGRRRRGPTSWCASRCHRCGRGSTWRGRRGPR